MLYDTDKGPTMNKTDRGMSHKKYMPIECLHVMSNLGMDRGISGGGFNNALIDLIFIADQKNLDKLELSFPEYVKAVKDYRTGKGHFA